MRRALCLGALATASGVVTQETEGPRSGATELPPRATRDSGRLGAACAGKAKCTSPRPSVMDGRAAGAPGLCHPNASCFMIWMI